MKHEIKVLTQVVTGKVFLGQTKLQMDFDAWELYEWHAGPLDAPVTFPAGSSLRDEDRYIGLLNVPSLAVRGM